MSQLITSCLADGTPNSGELRVVLETCRLDLNSLRKDVASDNSRTGQVSWAGQVRLERRLCRVIERLERMVDTLNEALNRSVHRVSATVAAEGLVREVDHCLRNRLQVLISLLEWQALRAETDTVRDALNLASVHVEAVSWVHATLHAASARCGIIPELDLVSYLGRLCAALERSMGVGRKQRAATPNWNNLPAYRPVPALPRDGAGTGTGSRHKAGAGFTLSSTDQEFEPKAGCPN